MPKPFLGYTGVGGVYAMIHAFGEAIAFMRARPMAVVGVAIIILLQAGIAYFQLPITNYFIATLDFDATLAAFDAIQVVGFLILMFMGLVLNFAGFLWIAQLVKVWKQHSNEKTSLQLLKAAGLVAAAIVLAVGLITGATAVLASMIQFLGFLGILLIGIVVLLAIYLSIKFMFFLPLMGFGLGLKQALQLSWGITQKQLGASIALLFGLIILTGIIDFVIALLIAGIDTELIAVPINFIYSTMLTTYLAAVLACAIPLSEIDSAPRMNNHAHGSTRMSKL